MRSKQIHLPLIGCLVDHFKVFSLEKCQDKVTAAKQAQLCFLSSVLQFCHYHEEIYHFGIAQGGI